MLFYKNLKHFLLVIFHSNDHSHIRASDEQSSQLILHLIMDKKRKILVIDDDAFQRMAIQSILETSGFEVVLSGDGDEGLDMIREDASIGLVLLDLLMPEKSGLEVLDDMQMDADDKVSNMPVVMITSTNN